MRLYTPKECIEWCKFMSIPLDEHELPCRPHFKKHHLVCRFPSVFTQLLYFSRWIEEAIQPRQYCLLWITDFGVFPSNENNHLYYRLRQSYGDFRLLHEAPGHLCLDYERPEVVTLLHLCILFGWDAHLIPCAGYAQAFVSHDEWVEIGFDDRKQLDDTKRAFEQAELDVSVSGDGEGVK